MSGFRIALMAQALRQQSLLFGVAIGSVSQVQPADDRWITMQPPANLFRLPRQISHHPKTFDPESIDLENLPVCVSAKTVDLPQRAAAARRRAWRVADERNQIGAYSRIRCEITVAEHVGGAGHRDHVNKPLLAHSPDLLLAHLGSLEPAESDQASRTRTQTWLALCRQARRIR